MSAIPVELESDRLSNLDVCREVVDLWRSSRYPDTLFEEETRMIGMRVNSWISRYSVAAGVGDVFGACHATGSALPLADIEALAGLLITRLEKEDRLKGQARGARPLSA